MNVLSAHVSTTDELLHLILEQIQLTGTKKRIALERFRAVRIALEESNCELVCHVEDIYPHGSARIGATVSSVGRDDQHDVDAMVEFHLARRSEPTVVLDHLAHPLRTIAPRLEIKRRCVQLCWNDMHIDATPAVLAREHPHRSSEIYDRSGGSAAEKWPISNPEGFARWFLDRTDDDYAQKVEKFFRYPNELEFPEIRPIAVSALQLVKRFRNKVYDGEDEDTGARRPPSILVTYFAGIATCSGFSLANSVEAVANAMISSIQQAEGRNSLITQINPACHAEILTDRWPRTHNDQQVWLSHLHRLIAKLKAAEQSSLAEQRSILNELFGENVAIAAVEKYRARMEKSLQKGTLGVVPSGRIVPACTTNATKINTSRHYGLKWQRY